MQFAVPAGMHLIETVGAGTFFELALVEAGGQRCLCKRLRPRLAAEPVALAAIAREREVLLRAHHPALPRLIDHGEDACGPWLIESVVGDHTLRQLVESWVAQRGQVPRAALRGIARVAFATLAELHALGDGAGQLELVHGDLAPDHLLVSRAAEGERGRVYFVDFGMARMRGMGVEPLGEERGSLPYVAPEVARGERPPGQAADVYALAACFAFAVLGREPCRAFSGASVLVEVAERGLDLAPLERCAELDEPLCGTLLQALTFDPARRLSDADAIAELLRRGG